MDQIDQIEAEYELQLKINKFVEPSMFAPISHFWRESESVANLQAKTQIFTQKNRSWLRFYSKFLNKDMAGGGSVTEVRTEIKHSPICSKAERVD